MGNYINPYYWVDFSHPLLYGNVMWVDRPDRTYKSQYPKRHNSLAPICLGSLWLTHRMTGHRPYSLLQASDKPERSECFHRYCFLIESKHTPRLRHPCFSKVFGILHPNTASWVRFWPPMNQWIPKLKNRDFVIRIWRLHCGTIVTSRYGALPQPCNLSHIARSQRFSWDGLLRMMVRVRMLPHLPKSNQPQTQIQWKCHFQLRAVTNSLLTTVKTVVDLLTTKWAPTSHYQS